MTRGFGIWGDIRVTRGFGCRCREKCHHRRLSARRGGQPPKDSESLQPLHGACHGLLGDAGSLCDLRTRDLLRHPRPGGRCFKHREEHPHVPGREAWIGQRPLDRLSHRRPNLRIRVPRRARRRSRGRLVADPGLCLCLVLHFRDSTSWRRRSAAHACGAVMLLSPEVVIQLCPDRDPRWCCPSA